MLGDPESDYFDGLSLATTRPRALMHK